MEDFTLKIMKHFWKINVDSCKYCNISRSYFGSFNNENMTMPLKFDLNMLLFQSKS